MDAREKIDQRIRKRKSWLARYPYDCRTLWVIGYPRSGTSFVARVLGDALKCPVFSMHEEGDLTDDVVANKHYTEASFIVRRAHYTSPDYDSGDNPYGKLMFRRNRGSKIIFVVRDPRALAYSCFKYHGFTFDQNDKGLEKAAKQLCGLEDRKPPIGVWRGKDRPGWAGYVQDWLDTNIDGIIRPGVLRYTEVMSDEAPYVIHRALRQSLFGSVDPFVIEQALANNTPEAWQERNDPALSFKRRAGVGSWREELPGNLQEMIVNECGDVMERLGYATG